MSSTHRKLPGTAAPPRPTPSKLVHQSGDAVYALWDPPTTSTGDVKIRGKKTEFKSWYPGTVTGSRIVKNHGSHGPVRQYDVQFDDGDTSSGLGEIYVWSKEDYALSVAKGATGKGWKGVKNVFDVDELCDDAYARTLGWYEATHRAGKGGRRGGATTERRELFASLREALHARDDWAVESKGAGMKRSDLNLPSDWKFAAGRPPSRIRNPSAAGREVSVGTTNEALTGAGENCDPAPSGKRDASAAVEGNCNGDTDAELRAIQKRARVELEGCNQSHCVSSTSHQSLPLKNWCRKGQPVYALWWNAVEMKTDGVWYPGMVSKCTVIKRTGKYGPTRLYNISFDDGHSSIGLEEWFVFPKEDYFLSVRQNIDSWKGIESVLCEDSSDQYAATVGWHRVFRGTKSRQVWSLSEALRIYDSWVVEDKRARTMPEDLNLASEWSFSSSSRVPPTRIQAGDVPALAAVSVHAGENRGAGTARSARSSQNNESVKSSPIVNATEIHSTSNGVGSDGSRTGRRSAPKIQRGEKNTESSISPYSGIANDGGRREQKVKPKGGNDGGGNALRQQNGMSKIKLELFNKVGPGRVSGTLVERKQRMRLRMASNEAPGGTPRKTFRRGCRDPSIKTVLGGVGTDPAPIVKIVPAIGASFIAEGEMFFAGRADWNPWTPAFAGDYGFLETSFVESHLRNGQELFHAFLNCSKKKHEPHYHGKEAANTYLYIGRYRVVPKNPTEEVQENGRGCLFSSLSTETQTTMAMEYLKRNIAISGQGEDGYGVAGTRDDALMFLDDAKAIAESDEEGSWEGKSTDERHALAWVQLALFIDYKIRLTPIQFVDYDEYLYSTLIDIGANSGEVSLDNKMLGPL